MPCYSKSWWFFFSSETFKYCMDARFKKTEHKQRICHMLQMDHIDGKCQKHFFWNQTSINYTQKLALTEGVWLWKRVKYFVVLFCSSHGKMLTKNGCMLKSSLFSNMSPAYHILICSIENIFRHTNQNIQQSQNRGLRESQIWIFMHHRIFFLLISMKIKTTPASTGVPETHNDISGNNKGWLT